MFPAEFSITMPTLMRAHWRLFPWFYYTGYSITWIRGLDPRDTMKPMRQVSTLFPSIRGLLACWICQTRLQLWKLFPRITTLPARLVTAVKAYMTAS